MATADQVREVASPAHLRTSSALIAAATGGGAQVLTAHSEVQLKEINADTGTHGPRWHKSQEHSAPHTHTQTHTQES